MIELSSVIISERPNGDLAKLFLDTYFRLQKKNRKRRMKAKEITDPGKYCPKEKPGQAWSYAKDVNKDKEDGEE